jgi:DNA mismatch repair protein MSH6
LLKCDLLIRCHSPFGERLLREWLCKPLQDPGHINARLDAVAELLGDMSPQADGMRAKLKRLPDIERQLARIHSLGSQHRR